VKFITFIKRDDPPKKKYKCIFCGAPHASVVSILECPKINVYVCNGCWGALDRFVDRIKEAFI
jgi:transcription elongation factor Elf1